ncbi:hypothetical protein HSBAA_13800 [Vreelandella sulfidaeris]|uniref:DUF112 domain-containing protein n=1 Tax=Vreelandella sulfidaeris TaxID=115553 RepID=A0A455U9S9_9GAMM|nr:hypothetical protein HSBAA_13800 [Halomonas sulfidaeris]
MTNFFLQALAEVGTPSVLGLIVIGVLFGIIGGSIPGFTVTMAILVVFPFTFAMDPVSGVSLMVGVFVGVLGRHCVWRNARHTRHALFNHHRL